MIGDDEIRDSILDLATALDEKHNSGRSWGLLMDGMEQLITLGIIVLEREPVTHFAPK
jgi:hypothetical protein